MTLLPKLPALPNKPRFGGIAFVPDHDRQQIAIKASKQEKVDTYDLIMQVMSMLGASLEFGLPYHTPWSSDVKTDPNGMNVSHVAKLPLKSVGNAAQGYVDTAKMLEARGAAGSKSLDGKRNPLFGDDLELGTASPVTQAYMVSRRKKKIGGSVFQAIGDVVNLAPHPGVGIPGAIYHGQASALTSAHLAKIMAIASRWRGDEYKQIQDWCKLIATMKGVKLATRGTQFAGSLVPVMSLPSSLLAASVKGGVKLTWTGACYAAAAEIMYVAYHEQWNVPSAAAAPLTPQQSQALTQPQGPPGAARSLPLTPPQLQALVKAQTQAARMAGSGRPLPLTPPQRRALAQMRPTPKGMVGPEAGGASSIIWEMFTKRGATRIFGAYDIAALIREPAGWLALGDKFMLI